MCVYKLMNVEERKSCVQCKTGKGKIMYAGVPYKIYIISGNICNFLANRKILSKGEH